jgi:hypothetical protein
MGIIPTIQEGDGTMHGLSTTLDWHDAALRLARISHTRAVGIAFR